MYFEPGGGYRESDVQNALRAGRLIPLRHMRAVPGRPDEVRLFYSQSASVVRFMMDEFGHERMDALLTELNEGRKIEDALIATYGVGWTSSTADGAGIWPERLRSSRSGTRVRSARRR